MTESHQAYWKRSTRLTAAILLIWTAVSFGLIWFARDLDEQVFGWPFSFYLGAQGALIVYCLLAWFYAWQMKRIDRECGLDSSGSD